MQLRDLTVRGKVLLIVATGILFQLMIAATGLYYLSVKTMMPRRRDGTPQRRARRSTMVDAGSLGRRQTACSTGAFAR